MGLHFFVYAVGTGMHLGSWRHPSADAGASIDFDHYRRLALTAEAAKFDAIFIADSLSINERSHPNILNRFEPVSLITALGAVTSRIGVVATASTSYVEPYNLARALLTADHVSGGRAGWNVVTTRDLANNTAGNFGRDEHFEHGDRYARAEEFVDVVRGLWHSWDDDAFEYDKEAGRFFDPVKLHRLAHRGTHFSVDGPLNIAPSPQGHPLIVQAGLSAEGRRLAGRVADVVFAEAPSLEAAREIRAKIRAEVAGFGRDPDAVAVLMGISPVVAATDDEAWQRVRDLDALITENDVLGFLDDYFGGAVDFSTATASTLVSDTAIGALENVRSDFTRHALQLADSDPTLRELHSVITGSVQRPEFIGTPERVADSIQRWFEGGAADGFILMLALQPADLEAFAAGVVPLLQQRGLFRTEYEADTLRGHLGIPPGGR
jgi:FMN-dependent oxidoreductase (nitrilotriacetate monooxygenase family)